MTFAGYMWDHMCSINMAADNLRRVCSNGSDSYSYDKYNIFQLEHGHFPNLSIPSICVTSENYVYRSGNYELMLEY